MNNIALSFCEHIKNEDLYDKTPAGLLWKKYSESNPELEFKWNNNVKYVDTFDSVESVEWAKYLFKMATKLLGGNIIDFKCDDSLAFTPNDIKNGYHLIVANWYYNMCHKNVCSLKNVSLRNLTRFESERRERIINKLTHCVGDFNMCDDEKDAICAYFLIRRSDKFKNMFIANKLFALQVLNRYATENGIRFEDAEAVMREYVYLTPHKM